MTSSLNYIDLFAGAGGLSEGFIRAGFNPIAHVEMDLAACNTLLTRTAYHHLKDTPAFQKYISYIRNEGVSRNELHALLPEEKILPGTANTSLPSSRAKSAVIKEPLRSAASTTTTPRDKPLIIRFRAGKCPE